MKYSFHLQEFWLHHHVLYWEWTDAGDLRKYGSDHKRMKVNKADEFYKILERKSIYPVFQPIVNLQTGRGSCFWYCIRNNREIRHRKLSDIAADHETLCRSGIWDSIGWCGSWTLGLNRVVNTTPDYLKADIELVRDIHKYKKKEIMMKLLLDYCNATGAILIAEGIETVQELECLHSLGVHYGQGFFLGKPERAFGNISAESEEILERLNRRKNILFLDISGK